MNAFDTLLVEDTDNVRTITLNRPQKLNAMSRRLIEEVAGAFEAANDDDSVNAIVLTGAGRAFCAGDDREEHAHPSNRDEALELVEAIQRVSLAMVLGTKPIVGAINGWAVGGGLEWAINCDFPIWARSARGFFPEISLNLFVTGGVTALLTPMCGLLKAREMLFLGRRYDAGELLDMGVAWRVVDDELLPGEATAVAVELANQPPTSCRAMKRVLSRTATENFTRAIALETEATVDGFMDPETTRRLKDF